MLVIAAGTWFEADVDEYVRTYKDAINQYGLGSNGKPWIKLTCIENFALLVESLALIDSRLKPLNIWSMERGMRGYGIITKNRRKAPSF